MVLICRTARLSAHRTSNAAASAAQLADAAATGAQRHTMTPEKEKPQEQVPGAEPDLVDVLLSRLRGGPGNSELPGNGTGAVESRATTVPTSLTRATKRLVEVGTTPLRVPERWGATFATSMLQASPTFAEYVERKALSGAHGREAATLARALDLGTVEFGPKFLMSTPAEVMVRRLMAVILGAKMGTFVMAGHLEELPGENALAELPDAVLHTLSMRMKLESKVQELAKPKQ